MFFKLLFLILLTAKKSRAFERVFSIYNRNLFWRRFAALEIGGIENLIERDKSLPLVLYANHSSWWDGLVAFEIGRRAKLDQFVMMEEKQLRQLFLFRLLGAFGVERENQRAAAQTVRYAVKTLNAAPNRALWIFPQGAIAPNERRPLEFFDGAAHIVKKTGKCCAAPVAMRYEFLNDYKPHAFARVGESELIENAADVAALTAHFAVKLTDLLDRLKREIAAHDQGNR